MSNNIADGRGIEPLSPLLHQGFLLLTSIDHNANRPCAGLFPACQLLIVERNNIRGLAPHGLL